MSDLIRRTAKNLVTWFQRISFLEDFAVPFEYLGLCAVHSTACLLWLSNGSAMGKSGVCVTVHCSQSPQFLSTNFWGKETLNGVWGQSPTNRQGLESFSSLYVPLTKVHAR